jgi:aminopeptidase YwaD
MGFLCIGLTIHKKPTSPNYPSTAGARDTSHTLPFYPFVSVLLSIPFSLGRSRVFSLWFVFFLILFAVCSVQGQNLSYARGVVDYLCSPELAGRGYTSKGHLKAAEYLRSEMEKSGAWPWGSYEQTFLIDANTFSGVMKLQMDDRELIPGFDFVVGPESPSLHGSFEWVLLNKETAGRLDSIEVLLNGPAGRKILVIDSSGFSGLPQKAMLEEIRKGNSLQAVAIIELVSGIPGSHISGRVATFPRFKIRKDCFSFETRLITVRMKNKLLSKVETRNILGFIKGELDSFVVFTAHYDHLGQMGKAAFFPGANDNASGVAMVLDLMHQYAKEATPLRYSVAFFFFSGEELGLLGSDYYCQHPRFPLSKIKLLINLDMVGTGEDGFALVNGKEFPALMAKMDYLVGKQAVFPPIQYRPAANNSDHAPFFFRGVPAVFLYTKGGYKEYHNLNDHPAKLPMNRYEAVFSLLVELVNPLLFKTVN